MTKSILSNNFSYSDLDCILICDGSMKNNIVRLGWVIIDAQTKIPLAEGRAITKSYISTVDAELLSIVTALQEVQKMNCSHILIKTDYEGFIKHLNPNDNTNISSFNQLDKLLYTFNTWGLKKVKRNDIDRAHNLCSSIDIDIDYVPIINID